MTQDKFKIIEINSVSLLLVLVLQVGEELDEWLLVPLSWQLIACNMANVGAMGFRSNNQIAAWRLSFLYGAEFSWRYLVV